MTNTTLEKLREMAQLTAMSGRINEVQEKNLKNFPMVFFDGVSEAKIDYDLSPITTNEEGTGIIYLGAHVKYSLTLNENENKDLNKRFKALESSVRTLFWSDLKVELYLNGKKYGV